MLHNRLIGATIVIASLVATATPVMTQSATPVFRAGTNVVLLQVTVTGRGGRAIDDLTAEDFTVLEDGVPQQISMVSKAEEPLALSLLLDTSGSMDESIGLAQRAAIQFIERLRSSDIAQVVSADTVPVVPKISCAAAQVSFAGRPSWRTISVNAPNAPLDPATRMTYSVPRVAPRHSGSTRAVRANTRSRSLHSSVTVAPTRCALRGRSRLPPMRPDAWRRS